MVDRKGNKLHGILVKQLSIKPFVFVMEKDNG